MAEAGELDLRRLDRPHQGDALAHAFEALGVLAHAYVCQRIHDGADAGRVDADLGEQPEVADLLDQTYWMLIGSAPRRSWSNRRLARTGRTARCSPCGSAPLAVAPVTTMRMRALLAKPLTRAERFHCGNILLS
jgi:hypothetical protein